MKKVLGILFMLFFVYFSIEWVVRGIHFFIFDSGSYVSFVRPILHWSKYLGVAFVLVVLLKKFVTLTEAGKVLSSTAFVVIVLVFLTASLWFNAVSEEKIVKQRVLSQDVYTWEDVEFVSTDLYRKRTTGPNSPNKFRPQKLVVKYNIHVEDGSVMNVWNDIDSIFELHQFVLEKGICVEYLYSGDDFESRYGSAFKESIEKARVIFGVD